MKKPVSYALDDETREQIEYLSGIYGNKTKVVEVAVELLYNQTKRTVGVEYEEAKRKMEALKESVR